MTNTAIATETFQRLLGDPEHSAILLDLDGTLAPIVPDPDGVAIDEGIRRVLPALRDRFGLVAFISGRSLDALNRIVGMPGVVYSGNHGQQLMGREGTPLPVPETDLTALQEFAERWSPETLDRLGVWLENKRHTLTFHYRNAADPDAAEHYLATQVAPVGTDAGLRVSPGRMSLEVHPGGTISKGTAAQAILDAHPGIRQVVSLGDDRTDVDVWRMLDTLTKRGDLDLGVGIGVLSDETPDIVREHAHLTVEGIPGSADVLARLAA